MVKTSTVNNRHKHVRHAFGIFVIEHRPLGADHPQDSRTLVCLDFSAGGIRLKGEPRYDHCAYTIALPPEFKKTIIFGKVVQKDKDEFAVEFTQHSPELAEMLSSWSDTAL